MTLFSRYLSLTMRTFFCRVSSFAVEFLLVAISASVASAAFAAVAASANLRKMAPAKCLKPMTWRSMKTTVLQ